MIIPNHTGHKIVFVVVPMFPNDYLDMSKRLRLFDVEVPIFRLLHLNTPTNHPKENILPILYVYV